MTDEILKYICPNCGKEIKSLYQKQFDFLKAQHVLSHEMKKEEKKEDV